MGQCSRRLVPPCIRHRRRKTSHLQTPPMAIRSRASPRRQAGDKATGCSNRYLPSATGTTGRYSAPEVREGGHISHHGPWHVFPLLSHLCIRVAPQAGHGPGGLGAFQESQAHSGLRRHILRGRQRCARYAGGTKKSQQLAALQMPPRDSTLPYWPECNVITLITRNRPCIFQLLAIDLPHFLASSLHNFICLPPHLKDPPDLLDCRCPQTLRRYVWDVEHIDVVGTESLRPAAEPLHRDWVGHSCRQQSVSQQGGGRRLQIQHALFLYCTSTTSTIKKKRPGQGIIGSWPVLSCDTPRDLKSSSAVLGLRP